MIFYDTCITLCTIYYKNYGTAHGRCFPNPYRLKLSYQSYHFETIPFILTNYSSMKLSSILQMEKSIIITTGTLTRVDCLRINK